MTPYSYKKFKQEFVKIRKDPVVQERYWTTGDDKVSPNCSIAFRCSSVPYPCSFFSSCIVKDSARNMYHLPCLAKCLRLQSRYQTVHRLLQNIDENPLSILIKRLPSISRSLGLMVGWSNARCMALNEALRILIDGQFLPPPLLQPPRPVRFPQ